MGKTLGPFPKTVRWHEIVARSLPPSRQAEAPEVAERTLNRLQKAYDKLTKDEAAIKATTFLAALPVSTREHDPIKALARRFTIVVSDPDDLIEALDGFLPQDSLAKRAAADTVTQFEVRQNDGLLIAADPWSVWREADGSAFCDLARLFFTNLNRHYFTQTLQEETGEPADPQSVDTFAHEMSLITRSFSARWFNACARYQTPEHGSIVWYLGHCLGKLDLELAREHADWVEPTGNPWKRKKKVETTLGI